MTRTVKNRLLVFALLAPFIFTSSPMKTLGYQLMEGCNGPVQHTDWIYSSRDCLEDCKTTRDGYKHSHLTLSNYEVDRGVRCPVCKKVLYGELGHWETEHHECGAWLTGIGNSLYVSVPVKQ